jgi:hypothetical protein
LDFFLALAQTAEPHLSFSVSGMSGSIASTARMLIFAPRSRSVGIPPVALR